MIIANLGRKKNKYTWNKQKKIDLIIYLSLQYFYSKYLFSRSKFFLLLLIYRIINIIINNINIYHFLFFVRNNLKR